MKWRLREGRGEAIYEIGVRDNGVLAGLSRSEINSSLQTLQQMALQLDATMTILRERLVEQDKKVIEVLIRKVGTRRNARATVVITHVRPPISLARARVSKFSICNSYFTDTG